MIQPAHSPPSQEAAPAAFDAFIDAIDVHSARLLIQGSDGEWRGYPMPAAVLPQGAREGQWLKVSLHIAATPSGADSAALRERLGRQDKGGNFGI